MNVLKFVAQLSNMGVGFYTGVPDSQLKPLCNYLMHEYGMSDKHIIAANEGNAVALAAGHYLSTGNVPCVYLQNSGLGNIINPVASLLNNRVYGIPCIFVVGWRGEPGVKDEPQHDFQGNITLKLLEVIDIAYMIIDKDTTTEDFRNKHTQFQALFDAGKSVAFVVKKGGLTYDKKIEYKNNNIMLREQIINHIVNVADEDIIISTTGKISRELFEIREKKGQSHKRDFLTVGSMGHSSSIALSIAFNKANKRVWCIDGDGALLMHMGSMAVIGTKAPKNYVHVVINNGAHESVGGMPTVASEIDLVQIALGCGYKAAYSVSRFDELDSVLFKMGEGPVFIEIKSAIGSRIDLGRPTTTPEENRVAFMSYLRECD